ncbi:hypothetical protein B0H63DRAFT_524055 [Podospora didyma]|uniref:Uncharacterized protein n=1 Tax=Podospora didyma TaxID=330526 RepID=A0AAE0NGY7_9PEZI|nr:hypothetical protein B0H63DRAFT_524055 [Podospora didyma]
MAQPQYSSDNNTSRAPAEASRGTFRPPGQYQYPSAGFENPQGYGGPPLAQALHRNHVLLPRAAALHGLEKLQKVFRANESNNPGPVDLPATGEIQQPFITPLGLVSPTKYVDLVASLERHEITARPMRMLVLDDDVPHNGIDIHFGRPFLEEYGARLLLVPSVPAASNSQANVWQSSYVGAQAQASTHLSTATSGSSQGLDSSPSVTTITSEGTPNSTSLVGTLSTGRDRYHYDPINRYIKNPPSASTLLLPQIPYGSLPTPLIPMAARWTRE